MLRALAIRWACNVAALWVAARLLDGVSVTGDTAATLILAGLVFSVVNMVVKPVVTVLAIPLIVITLGIAYFLVNVLMLFVTSWLVDGFHVAGFWWGVAAALIVWAVNALLAGASRRFERT